MMHCMADGVPPPVGVLQAFGLRGEPCPLPGGQCTTWHVGDVVLKPGSDPRLQAWLGTELATVNQVGFVLPEVVRCRMGAGLSRVGAPQGCSRDPHRRATTSNG